VKKIGVFSNDLKAGILSRLNSNWVAHTSKDRTLLRWSLAEIELC